MNFQRSDSKMDMVKTELESVDENWDESNLKIDEEDEEPTVNATNNSLVFKSDPTAVESQDSGFLDLSMTTSQLLYPSNNFIMDSRQSENANLPGSSFLDATASATPSFEQAEDDFETSSQTQSINFFFELQVEEMPKQKVLKKQIVKSIEEEAFGIKYRVDFVETTVKKRNGETIKTFFPVPSIIDE